MADQPPAPDSPTPTPATPNPNPASSTVGGPAPVKRTIIPVSPQPRTGGGALSSPHGGGSYIGELSRDDAKWKSGAFVLCLLFALIFVAEGLSVWADILSGESPGVSVLTLTRAAIIAELFVGIWMGWDWLRWLTGAACAGYGLWRIAWSFAVSNAAAAAAGPLAAGAARPTDWVFVIHVFAGVMYVAFGAFVSLTEGASDFARHRRENGGKGAVAVVFLAGLACIGGLFAVKPLTAQWIAGLQGQALAFGESSLREMAAQWDPNVYESHMTPAYKKDWAATTGHAGFNSMKMLGGVRSVDHASAPVNVSLDGLGHLAIATTYKAHVMFEHQGVSYENDIERGPFTGWQQGRFTLGFDPKPGATTPTAPAAVPGAPAAASPAAAPGAAVSPALGMTPTVPNAATGPKMETAPTATAPSPAASAVPTPVHSPAAKL